MDNEDRLLGGPPDYGEDLGVRRLEEDVSAKVRQTEAGSVNVRKNVRTEREQVRVPKRREEVELERVPVEGGEEVTGVEIGAGEVFVVKASRSSRTIPRAVNRAGGYEYSLLVT